MSLCQWFSALAQILINTACTHTHAHTHRKSKKKRKKKKRKHKDKKDKDHDKDQAKEKEEDEGSLLPSPEELLSAALSTGPAFLQADRERKVRETDVCCGASLLSMLLRGK